MKKKLKSFWNNSNELTRNVSRSLVYSIGLKSVGILLSLITIPVTLSFINQYEYGVWITINSVLTWIYYFDLGLGNGLRNKLTESLAKKDKLKGKQYVSTTFILLSVLSIVFYFLFFILSQSVDWHKILNIGREGIDIKLIIQMVMAGLCLNFILKNVGVVYISYQKAWVNDFLTFMGSLTSLVIILILKSITLGSVFKVAFVYTFSPVFVYIIAYPITFMVLYKDINPSIKSFKKTLVKDIAVLGFKFLVLQLACLLMFSTSNLIISRLFSPLEVTPYSIASRYFAALTMFFMIIINTMWSAITNAFARDDYNWIKSCINKLTLIWFGCCLIAILMVIVSKLVFRLWIGNDINIPYTLSIALAVYNLTYMLTNIYSSYCNGTGNLNGALISMTTASVAFIPLAVFLGKTIGVQGVAYGLAASLIIPLIIMFLQYKGEIKKYTKI